MTRVASGPESTPMTIYRVICDEGGGSPYDIHLATYSTRAGAERRLNEEAAKLDTEYRHRLEIEEEELDPDEID